MCLERNHGQRRGTEVIRATLALICALFILGGCAQLQQRALGAQVAVGQPTHLRTYGQAALSHRMMINQLEIWERELQIPPDKFRKAHEHLTRAGTFLLAWDAEQTAKNPDMLFVQQNERRTNHSLDEAQAIMAPVNLEAAQ